MDLTLLPEIQKTFNLPPIKNIIASLPKHPTHSPWPTRSKEAITEIVVHHAGDTGTIRNEALYHIRERGWYTIGYHISIDRGGIYQLNDLLSITNQAKGANGYSIGVCINWNLQLRPPTDFEMKALIGVILSLKSVLPNIKVRGHKEVGKQYGYVTACPVISMDKLRSDIHSAEEELSFQQDTAALSADSYKLAVRVRDLQSKLTHKVWGIEAGRKLTKLNGVIEGTANEIATTVLSLYKLANEEQFIGDTAVKLAEVVAEAKRVRLI